MSERHVLGVPLEDGVASFVVLPSTSERALDTVPLAALEEHAVDVPSDPRGLAD